MAELVLSPGAIYHQTLDPPRKRDKPLHLIVVLFASLCTVLLCMSSGVAAEKPIYSDVPVTHPYYDAIQYFSSEGIVGGVGGGRFQPDREITVGEFSAILMRTYYPERDYTAKSGMSWSEPYLIAAKDTGVISWQDYYLLKLNRAVTWAQLGSALIRASNLPYYPAWCYTGDSPSYKESLDTAYAAMLYGIIPSEAEQTKAPTRGETLSRLYQVLSGDLNELPVPEILSQMPPVKYIGGDESDLWKIRNIMLNGLAEVPGKYLTEFAESGWTLQVTGKLADLFPQFPTAAGVTSYGDKKTITIGANATRKTVVHEFGHFAMKLSQASPGMEKLYQKEGTAVAELAGPYAKTNQNEMFAEAFVLILRNRNNENLHAEMEKKIPLTLELIESGYLDAEGTFDEDAVIKVFEKLETEQ